MWRVVFTRQAQKDAKKLSAAGLRSKAEKLLNILSENPYQTPPYFEKLIGDGGNRRNAKFPKCRWKSKILSSKTIYKDCRGVQSLRGG